MLVEVEINSQQIFENSQDSEKNKCIGEITYYNKGAILQFTEKYENQELKFKMTILHDKIITIRNNQSMIFDIKNKHNTTLNTPYGVLSMKITTKILNVIQQTNKIKEIHLGYEIELENGIQYYNKVDIAINEMLR